MDEMEFRATLSNEELQARALILPFKILDITVFEKLNKYSAELSKNYDYLINTALIRLFNDIETIWDLRCH